jgi:hypothetical protein
VNREEFISSVQLQHAQDRDAVTRPDAEKVTAQYVRGILTLEDLITKLLEISYTATWMGY